MRALNPEREQEQARALARMKRVPLLLLLLMAALFVFTLGHPAPWAPWAHAFAEAGMVGALADWFAVVALFRHPLGLPIPHTAIIPRRKNELGESMSRFVADHFLEPGAVRAKLQTIDLAGYTVSWLKGPGGQAKVVDFAEALIRWALDALDEQRVRKFLGRLSRRQLEKVDLAPLLGHTLDWLVRGGRHQDILTQMLRQAIVLLDEHRDAIRGKVQEESPWWIPGFVDDRILRKMLERIEARLYEISLDPEHSMRVQFDRWVEQFAGDLKTSPEHRATGERIKQQLLDNNELQDYLYRLWVDLAGRLEADLDADESKVRAEIGGWVERLAGELERDPDIQAWMNEWLTEAVVTLVDSNRAQIASVISDTVQTWDGRDTSRRVELALGRDLQFIRINGTLVGGLVGLAINAATQFHP